ncbi:MAG: hypothetical protein MUF03_03960 [Rubrivivax sp.]|nr:hypothetical protein [Rubrivivax sp.]
MSTLRLIFRNTPRTTLADPSRLRPEAMPPSLRCAPGSAWQRLLFWLLAPSPQDAAPPVSRLPAVRDEFLVALVDVDGDDADALRKRVASARSLRELWHLRPAIYHAVGVGHDQAEAERRVADLDRHFPTRAPRSGFVPLSPR